MYVTLLIRHSGDLSHTVPLPCQPPHYQVLSIGKYHICDGQSSGLVEAVQVARIGGVDLMILTETKITYKDYCQHKMGYD